MITQKTDALGCTDYLQHCINVLCRIGMVSGKKSPVSECRTLGWDALAKLVTSHTVAESKDGPGWVPGKIDPGPRKGERVECWDVLALDIEAPAENLGSGGSGNAAPGVTKRRKELSAPPLGDVAAELKVLGWAAALATTYSHEEPAMVASVDGDTMGTLGPRYRVVFPLSRPIESEEIKPLGLQVLAMLGLVEVADTSCLESARLFYLPTCPSAREGLAQRAIVQGKPLDVEDLLRVASKSAEAAPMVRPNALTKKASVIDAFNDQSDMGHLLEGFGYLAKGSRWVWPGSTTGEPGVYLVPNSEPPRVVSRHANDPLHHPDHRSHDPFSVWCELQHGGDYKKAVGEAAAMLGMSNSKPPTPIYDVSGFHAGIGGAYEQEVVNVSRYRLLRSADIAQLPPLRWLVRSVLPAEGLAAVYGPSGSGKSFLAMDLFAAVAEGRRWFEYRVEARPVVYLALEGEGGIRLRVQAWETKNGRPLPDSMAVVVQPFKLTCPADIADLVAAISAVGWVSGAVVVLDTLNRAAPTSDENASKDMGEILEGAKALQASLGGLVVVVHHTGKDATKGLRGHSSMFAALDACVEVTRDGERRAWSVAKSKDGQDGDRHSFTLDVVDLGLDDYGDEITSCVPVAVDTSTAERGTRLSNGAQAALDAFCAAAAKHGTCDDPNSAAAVVRLDLDDWRVAFYERSTADNADAKKQAFIRARRALVEAGKVTVSNFVYSMKVTEPGLVVARLVAAKEAEQGDSNGTTEEHCSDPLALEA